ncbi:MAG: DUF1579 domain-containing protein [Verrucomicrobiota bacterium]
MKIKPILTLLLMATGLALPAFAQGPAASPIITPADAIAPAAASSQPVATAQMSEPEMMKQMMELSKLNENHKMLADLAGTWSYTVKMWMNGDPTSKPQESKGTAVRKSVMDGRFFTLDVSGKMQMPGADGKMKDMNFKGMGVEGYDNVKKKFTGIWMDNMGTGFMTSEGDYDAASKTFTYTGEYEGLPGMKQKIREVLKIVDKDHHNFEWYEDRGGKEVKTMEISYTRKK